MSRLYMFAAGTIIGGLLGLSLDLLRKIALEAVLKIHGDITNFPLLFRMLVFSSSPTPYAKYPLFCELFIVPFLVVGGLAMIRIKDRNQLLATLDLCWTRIAIIETALAIILGIYLLNFVFPLVPVLEGPSRSTTGFSSFVHWSTIVAAFLLFGCILAKCIQSNRCR